MGRYVKSGYAYLIKKPLCCSGLDSSKRTLLDVERHNPAPILFFPPCKVTLNTDINHIPPSHAGEWDSMGACGWQLGLMGWLFSLETNMLCLSFFLMIAFT